MHEHSGENHSRSTGRDAIFDKVHSLHTAIQQHLQHDPRGCVELAVEALALARSSGDTTLIAQSLVDLGRCRQMLNEYPDALALYTEASTLLGDTDNHPLHVLALRNMAWVYRLIGDYTRSMEFYLRALDIAETHELRIATAQCLNGLGTLYSSLGDYSRAIDCYQRSLVIRQNAGDKDLGAVYTNIGNMYHRLGHYEEALEYYRKRLALCSEDLAADTTRALTLQNVGATMHELGEHGPAEEYTRQALGIFETLGDRGGAARCLTNLGCIYQIRGLLGDARELYRKALALAEDIRDLDSLAGTLTNIGTLCTIEGSFTEAAEYLLRALALVEQSGSRKMQCDIYRHLSEAFERLGDASRALEYYKLYNALNNELLGREKHMALHELQNRFRIERLEKEKEIYRLKNVELAQALAEVEKLNAHLRRIDTEKNELLGVVVHDLKSPLSNILMLAQLIARGSQTLSPADIAEFAGDIETVGHRMMELIVNLLDFDSMESGTMNLNSTAVDLVAVVSEVLSLHRERAAAKSILLHTDLPTEALVQADRDALARVVDNLISNAIKYSPPDRNIYIRVHMAQDGVCCTVRDEGPGMTAEDRRKLFGKFVRLSARPTGGEHSTGLGLSIVKKLMDAMNGAVWCESREGQGAAFIIRLPGPRQ